jgi:hypothetical protein
MDRRDQIETCEFFNAAMTEMPTVAEMMKRQHCHRDHDSCARTTVLDRLGHERVPVDLAPNEHDRARQIIEGAD